MLHKSKKEFIHTRGDCIVIEFNFSPRSLPVRHNGAVSFNAGGAALLNALMPIYFARDTTPLLKVSIFRATAVETLDQPTALLIHAQSFGSGHLHSLPFLKPTLTELHMNLFFLYLFQFKLLCFYRP